MGGYICEIIGGESGFCLDANVNYDFCSVYKLEEKIIWKNDNFKIFQMNIYLVKRKIRF